jgi:hypothetical protein
MFDPQHDFFRCLTNARIATRKRDFDAADKWMKLAERHMRLLDSMLIAHDRGRRIRPIRNPLV